MAEAVTLKDMLMSFRVSELRKLLRFAGQNRSGKKFELQARAVELLRSRSTPVEMKVKELYKTIHTQHTSGATMQQPAPSKDIPSVHSASIKQQQNQQRSSMYSTSGYQSDRALAPPGTGMNKPNIDHHPYQAKASPPVPYSFPLNPNAKLKRSPFFEFLGELLKPSTLVPQGTEGLQESSFTFHLTPQQATEVASSRDRRPGGKIKHGIEVQLRFCLIETSCEQEDCYPSGIVVKVNGKVCPLPKPIPTNKPGVEPKRPPPPVNITPLIKLSPTLANRVTVQWNLEDGKVYCVSVDLVRIFSSSDLLQRLKQRRSTRPDHTRGLIKDKFQEDAECEIVATSLRVSLLCPLGQMRMTTPCRSATCSHLQCFDASSYLQMNEKKPTWMCPVCNKPATYDNLIIDGYFQQVLVSSKLGESNEIQLHQDGSWSSLIVRKEPEDLPEQCVNLEPDDVVIIPEPAKKRPRKQPQQPKKEPDVIDLTFSDSDDGSDSVMEVTLV